MPDIDPADLQRRLLAITPQDAPGPARGFAPPSASEPGGAPLPGAKINPTDLLNRLRGSDDAPSTSMWEALKQGLLRGGRDVLEGGAQIGARMGAEEGGAAFADPQELAQRQETVDAVARQSEREFQDHPSVIHHGMAAAAGRIGGNMAAMAPAALAGGGPASLIAGAGRTGAGLLAGGALTGAAAGVTQPVTNTQDYWTEKLRQAGAGAVAGAAIPAIGSAISPRLPAPQLIAQGVSRAFRPLYNFFTGAEERTINGFDRTIARQVLDPIGGRIDGRPAAHELNRQVESQISDAYDRVLPDIKLTREVASRADPELDKFVSTMSSDHRDRYNSLVQKYLDDRFPATGIMEGKVFQRAQSEIGKRVRSWLGTNDDELGRAALMKLDQLHEAIAQTNPRSAPELTKANESFRLWARMRQAASNPRKDGEFSPDDLMSAISKQEGGRIWAGDKPLQGYAVAGRKAMGREATDLFDLLHLFHRHGLAGSVAEATVGAGARMGKATSPITSPILGAQEARDVMNPPSPQQRMRDRLRAQEKMRDIQKERFDANRRGDLVEMQRLTKSLAAAQADYRRLGGSQ